jgi:hypothetical protein
LIIVSSETLTTGGARPTESSHTTLPKFPSILVKPFAETRKFQIGLAPRELDSGPVTSVVISLPARPSRSPTWPHTPRATTIQVNPAPTAQVTRRPLLFAERPGHCAAAAGRRTLRVGDPSPVNSRNSRSCSMCQTGHPSYRAGIIWQAIVNATTTDLLIYQRTISGGLCHG